MQETRQPFGLAGRPHLGRWVHEWEQLDRTISKKEGRKEETTEVNKARPLVRKCESSGHTTGWSQERSPADHNASRVPPYVAVVNLHRKSLASAGSAWRWLTFTGNHSLRRDPHGGG
jgi:hypothetical protein